MISSAVRSFQDPWDHQAFFRAGNMKLVATTTDKYNSSLVKIDLHRLWMQLNEMSSPLIAHVADTSNRCAIGFIADPRHPPPYHNGEELQPDMMIVSSIKGDHHYRMRAPTQIASMSLSPSDLAAASQALIGRELTAPAVTRQMRISAHVMARLRRIHQATCHLAVNTPDILTHPEVARAMEEELVRSMVDCLAEAATVERKAYVCLRMPVMQRFERIVGEAEGRPLYLTEICAKIGVQERTLRNHCIEYLGMSPHRYLWLRRMTQAKRALSLAEPTEKTVTTIANDYGFWELGRFSVAYRKLFGESPSTTLRNSAEHAEGAACSDAPQVDCQSLHSEFYVAASGRRRIERDGVV